MRTNVSATTLAALLLAGFVGCSSSRAPDVAEDPENAAATFTAGASALIPHSTYQDWVGYADQLSVFTVVTEETMPFSAADLAAGIGYTNRILTVRIEDTPWRRPGAPVLEGDAAEIVATGFVLDDGETVPATTQAGLRLEVGQRYVAALVNYPETGWSPIQPESAILLDDEGRAAPLTGQRDPAVTQSAGWTPAEIGAVLDRTAPEPDAARLAALDPVARFAAATADDPVPG